MSPSMGPEAILAGGLSGAVSTLAVFPLDSLKLRVQMGRNVFNGGLASFYRGVTPAMFGAIPSTALRLTSTDQVRNWMQAEEGDLRANILSGAIGAIFGALVVVPREVVKQGMQSGLYLHFDQAVREIFRHQGLRGFFVGAVPTLLHDIPFCAINSSVFYYLRERELSVFQSGVVAASTAAALTVPIGMSSSFALTRLVCVVSERNTSVAKFCKCIICFSSDLVRTQALSDPKFAKLSFLKAITSIIRDHGVRGLFRGTPLRLATIAPMFTIIWLVYDKSYMAMCEVRGWTMK